MLLLLPLVALAALVVQGAPNPDEGRALDWLWDLPQGQYPQVNRAGLVPTEELEEEGRRRTNKAKNGKTKPSKRPKDQDTTVFEGSSNFDLQLPAEDEHTSHNVQELVQTGWPLITFQKPETVTVPVTIPTSSSVMNYVKGLFPQWVWNPPPLSVATPQINFSNLKPQVSIVKPQVSPSKPPEHPGTVEHQASVNNPTHQFSFFKPQVSLSNLVPQVSLSNLVPHFSSFIPTQAPIVHRPVVVPPAHKPVPLPTKSEVMVLRYPEFIKYIGRGISKVSNAMKTFGQEMSDSLANKFNFQSIPTKIGAGVAAIIPLQDETDTHQVLGTIKVPVPSIPKPVFGSGLNLGSLFNKGSGVSVSGSASGSLSVSTGGSKIPHSGGTQHSQTSLILDQKL